MKPPPFDYHAPASLAEAISLKSELGDESSLLAGGQSLIPMLNLRIARPAALIDLRKVEELRAFEVSDDGVTVGAMVRQAELERSSEVEAVCPLLREAQSFVGHQVIRNRGTIGGSIAHADPAAELPVVLALLGGSVRVEGPGGKREIAARDFFQFHFTTAIAPDEVLTEIVFPPLDEGTGYAFVEFSRRHGDYPLASAAAIVQNGSTKLCFGAVGPRPILVDSSDESSWVSAVDPASDIHASSEYRTELVRVLGARALDLAERRAGGAS